jgi:endonuclease/exonuclease/phosphatase family metal-dependent hydrolase
MGDMNATESNNAYRELIGSNDPTGFQLLDSFREIVPLPGLQERTFNGFTGASIGSRIDYILHSNFFQAEQASIVRTEFNGQYPSDHYPVTALLRPIPEPASILLLVAGALPLLASRRSRSLLT